MSSSIDRLVPIFGGDNYPGWAVTIESYLMSLGIWGVIEDFFESDSRPVYLSAAAQTSSGSALPGQFSASSASAPASGPAASSADSATGTSTSAAGGGADIFNKAATAPADALKEKKKDKEWAKANTQAMGCIRMRCSPAIADKLRPLPCAFDMWSLLEFEYGKVGLMGAFTIWRQALATTIPGNASPMPAIDKINQYIHRLHDLGVEIPAFIHGMILISKLPEYMNIVTQMAAQATGIASISPTVIRQAAINAWESKASKGRGGNGNGNGDGANKITAVKRNNGNKQFNQQQGGQQQQQRGQGSGQGQAQQQQQSQGNGGKDNKDKKRRRGPRKGKNAANVTNNDSDDLESLVGGAVVNDTPTKYLTGPANPGYIFKSFDAPAPRALSNTYPSLTRASEIARYIGERGSAQTLRVLEKVVASGFVREGSPSAHISEVGDATLDQTDETPNGNADTSFDDDDDLEDERAAKRFKSISLFDRMEPRPFEYNESAWRDEPIPDGTSFGEDDQIANAAGVVEEPESVPLSHTHAQCAHHCSTASAERDACPQVGYLDNWMTLANGLVVPINDNLCVHSKDYAMCGKCKGKSSASHVRSSDWLLDSGASNTYTMDMSDFVEYSPNQKYDKRL